MPRFVRLCAAALCLCGPASAEPIDARAPETLVQALQDLGYRAKLEVDNLGDPLIESTTSGLKYSIYFYGCEANANCQDLLFSAGFNDDVDWAASDLNPWNAGKLVGRAYVDDEGDPILDHFVSGVLNMTPEAFERTVARWDLALGEFADFIDW